MKKRERLKLKRKLQKLLIRIMIMQKKKVRRLNQRRKKTKRKTNLPKLRKRLKIQNLK